MSVIFSEGSVHENKHGQKYIVIKKIDKAKAEIEFIDTGYKTEMFASNRKTVIDRSHTGFSKTTSYPIGGIIENNRGEKAEILDYRSVPKTDGSYRYEHLLKFIDTGYTVWADCYNFKQGKTTDRLKPTVHGLGSIGNPPEEAYPLKGNKEYRLWANVILRCSDKYENNGYKNVTCSERWKRFDFFYEDVKKLFNYELWKICSKTSSKNPYEIDKDILVKDNNVYSKETCMFVDKSINAGFTNWQSDESRDRNRNRILKELGINAE